MTSPHVSICVPTYNGAAYLVAALDSIRAQTFEDFEVLIVDDGSVDDSVSIARDFASTDPRFRVEVNASNRGLVGNWNRCIELASGPWIKFAFQDDLLGPDCLQRMLAAAERNDADFVACARHLLFAPDTDPSLRRFHDGHDRLLASVHGPVERMSADDYCRARLDHLAFNIVGEPTATLLRRDLFDRWGPFDAGLVQICDSELWDRVATNVGLAYVAEPLATFRVHGGSASGRNRQQRFRSGVLEQIVYLQALCHGPAFTNLRRVADAVGRGRSLRQRLSAHVHMALDQLRWADGQGRDGVAMKADFDAVIDRFPALRPKPLDHLAWRIRRKLQLPVTEDTDA